MQTATERNGEAVTAGTVEAGYLLLSSAFQATENQRDKCCFRAKEMRDQPLAPSILREGSMGLGWDGQPHRTDTLPAQNPTGTAAAALAPHHSQGSSTARKYGLIKKKKDYSAQHLNFTFHPATCKTILLCEDH